MSSATPSPDQIRAALALLNWENRELSEAAGVAVETVYNVKSGATQPQAKVREKIRRAFEAHGIEFLDFDGVRRRPEGIDILEGPEGFEEFYDRVFAHVQRHGGLICVSGVDEDQFARHHGKEHTEAHIARMTALCAERDDIVFRALVREGDTNFVASGYAAYRWQPRHDFSAAPFYVFGDNLALITFDANPAPKVLMIRSAVFAEAYRKQFQIAWEAAKTPPGKRPR